MKNIKKNLLILTSSIMLLSLFKEKEYHPNYTITEDEKYFATYRNGKVYISDKIDDFLYQAEENDILIIDGRNDEVPDITIYDSYKITDYEEMYEILLILEEYEKENPSNWNRTIDSMHSEWVIHNICYFLNYKREKTKDVDLDNEEEFLYHSLVLKKILRTR